MSDLYYVAPDERAALRQGRGILTGAEARHLSKVMRGKPGDEVALFDGSGVEYRARILTVGRDVVELEILETREDDREPDVAVTALVALPKGDRQKWAIEKLCELGVRRVVPLDCRRSDVKFDDGVRERLERQALEASKQCGRLRLMSITPSVDVSELAAFTEILYSRLGNAAAPLSPLAQKLQARFDGFDLFDEFQPGDDALRVLAHPRSDGDFGQLGFRELIHSRGGRVPRGVLAAIGPAGGFAADEVQMAVASGWTPLDLGRQVYRVETAAIVTAALFLHLT